MKQYGNDIKIELFYDFLCSKVPDDIADIRKMYMYHRSFIVRYQYAVHDYDEKYSFDNEEGWNARAFLEKAHLKYQLMTRMTDECYLAILLHKLDYEIYKKIIRGLYGYFQYSDAEVIPPLKNLQYKTKEFDLTKDEYIKRLTNAQSTSTNVGEYLNTSSLGSIIEIEQELIKPTEKEKCLRIDENVGYEDLKIFK